ncbi:MAG: Ig-like domain-containing protein [Anaerolineales bacterium]|nr:Ig-like domain-containing protein [Anaerolineales bacterium]
MNRSLRLLVLLAVFASSCTRPDGLATPTPPPASPQSYGAGLKAWIDRPLDGTEYALGDSIPIRWHATNTGGIQEVELRINGETWQVDRDFDPNGRLVTQELLWTPPAAGDYRIEVIPSGVEGAVGPAAAKRVTVLGEGGLVQGFVFSDLNQDGDAEDAGEGPLENVEVFLLECTEKVSQRTDAVGAFLFEDLPFGDDCRLDFVRTAWKLVGTSPTGIALPIYVRPSLEPGSLTVFLAPEATPTPTVTPTPTATRTPMPTDTPLPDDDPPPKPGGLSPKEEIVGCLSDIVLDWNEPDDPSGIDRYEVELFVSHDSGASWSSVGTWQVESTSLDVSGETDCGGFYSWSVNARDNAGNWGQKNYAQFGIDLP